MPDWYDVYLSGPTQQHVSIAAIRLHSEPAQHMKPSRLNDDIARDLEALTDLQDATTSASGTVAKRDASNIEGSASHARGDPAKPCFLELPGEVRNQVYEKILIVPENEWGHSSIRGYSMGAYVRSLPGSWERGYEICAIFINPGLVVERLNGLTLGVLSVNRQVHCEAASLFYGKNNFVIRDANLSALDQFIRIIGPQNASYMRYLTLEDLSRLRLPAVGNLIYSDLSFSRLSLTHFHNFNKLGGLSSLNLTWFSPVDASFVTDTVHLILHLWVNNHDDNAEDISSMANRITVRCVSTPSLQRPWTPNLNDEVQGRLRTLMRADGRLES